MVRQGRTSTATKAQSTSKVQKRKAALAGASAPRKSSAAQGMRPGEYFESLVTRLREQVDDYHLVSTTLDKYNTPIIDLKDVTPLDLPIETVSTFLNGPLRDTIETIYPSLLKLLNGNGSIYSIYKPPNIVK